MSIPLSLYLHFPWCVRKCPYCDFNSHALRDELPEEAYVQALIRDLDFELVEPESRPLQSIFMGGGTPSLFSGAAIGSVLEAVAARLSFADDIEITLEANPGTAEAARFVDYRAAGVNRLSIGVQSLDDAQLRQLGRIHDRAAAIDAVRMARAAGFLQLNLDLMFALPGQTADEALTDLHQALALEPEHLSYYQLTLEPNTEFAARPPALPDDDQAWQMQSAGQDRLAAAGYAQYEVSAYARPDCRAQHNLNYWRFGDYLGIGAGAHGKRTLTRGIQRRARHKHPRSYLAAAGGADALQENRMVSPQDLPFEYCMNALRLNQGFRWSDFEQRTALDRGLLAAKLQSPQDRGLIRLTAQGAETTALGKAHLNTLLTLLL